MNDMPRRPPASDDDRFDRLVDGELTPDEYRRFLASLDEQPDGWRRCALAFLEAQAWRQELRAVRAPSDVAPPLPAVTPVRAGRQHRWPLVLAVAASFLVAFGLGLAFRGAWSGAPDRPGTEALAGGNAAGTPGGQPGPAMAVEPPQLAVDPGLPGPGGNLRLVVDGGTGTGGQPLEIPLYELSPENAWLLSGENLRVPADVHRSVQQMGGQLQWRRHLVPVQTSTGRQVVLPVEQLEITPVDRRRYQ